MARITPLAEAATDAPVTAILAAAGLTLFVFCLVAFAAHLDRWVAAREAQVGSWLRRHARRIGHGVGADNRRINDWVEEIAPRPDGPA